MPAITGIAAHYHSPPDGSLNILKRYRLPLSLLQSDVRGLEGAVEKPLKSSGGDVSTGLLSTFMHCSMGFLQCSCAYCDAARLSEVERICSRLEKISNCLCPRGCTPGAIAVSKIC